MSRASADDHHHHDELARLVMRALDRPVPQGRKQGPPDGKLGGHEWGGAASGFHRLDRNADGVIELDELAQGLLALPPDARARIARLAWRQVGVQDVMQRHGRHASWLAGLVLLALGAVLVWVACEPEARSALRDDAVIGVACAAVLVVAGAFLHGALDVWRRRRLVRCLVLAIDEHGVGLHGPALAAAVQAIAGRDPLQHRGTLAAALGRLDQDARRGVARRIDSALARLAWSRALTYTGYVCWVMALTAAMGAWNGYFGHTSRHGQYHPPRPEFGWLMLQATLGLALAGGLPFGLGRWLEPWARKALRAGVQRELGGA